MNGIYLFAEQIDKCREKVWKKGVEFEEGEKDLSSKGLFPLLKYRPLLGTEQIKKAAAYIYCAEVILPFLWIAGGIIFGLFPPLSLLVLPALKLVLDNVKKVMRFPLEGEKMLWGVDEATAKIQLIFSLLLVVSLLVDKLFL